MQPRRCRASSPAPRPRATRLGQGGHTFAVRAKDAAGNTGPATSRTFTVDTVGPATTIGSGPTGPTASTSASFGFSSEGGATFQCNRDGGGWQACSSPQGYSGLSQGAHTFDVRATDQAGNTGSATSRSWSVDTVGPAAAITAGPAQDSTITTSATSFSFTGEAGGSFDCKLDGGAWGACTSPNAISGLTDGSHTFRVRAKDALGNAGSEAARTFTVDTPAPPTPPATPAEPQTPEPEKPVTPSTPESKPKPKPKPSYASTVMGTRGLEAMFGLGDSGRRAADAKGGQAGRFLGSPRRVAGLTSTGRDRSAHAFDGRDDRVSLDRDSLGRPRAFSIELWLDAARTRRTTYVLTAAADRARDGFSLALDAAGRPVLSSAGVKGAKASRVVGSSLGTSPRHLVATYDGRRLRLYVDGALRATSAPTTLKWSRTRKLVLGADLKGAHAFKGTLDELAFYDRALSSATVKAHRSAGR